MFAQLSTNLFTGTTNVLETVIGTVVDFIQNVVSQF